VICAADLTVRFGERAALDGVSFDVAAGEAVALVGANGSGKTTALRALLGLCPFAGRASVGGHDVLAAPVAARRLVGYLPQRPAFGDATALEVLGFVAKLRRVDAARVAAVLDEVGLSRHARERARTFSGGMAQRLSLAVALLADPEVFFLDEPTASLDREGQAAFLDIAGALRRRGRTLLLASHRSEEIARLADRVLCLDEGRLAPEAAPVAPVDNVVTLHPRAARR
jgi:ABC-2 type transport system ATP-binding protein